MGKVVDGVELLRMIRDGEIKDKQTFKNITVDLLLTYDNNVLYYYNENLEHNREFFEDYGLSSILNYKFEILSEEDEEIDIQGIEEIQWKESDKEYLADGVLLANDKINQLIKVVKQLDKKIKEKTND